MAKCQALTGSAVKGLKFWAVMVTKTRKTIIVLNRHNLQTNKQFHIRPTSVGFNQSFKSIEKSSDIRPTASVLATASRIRSWSSSGCNRIASKPPQCFAIFFYYMSHIYIHAFNRQIGSAKKNGRYAQAPTVQWKHTHDCLMALSRLFRYGPR